MSILSAALCFIHRINETNTRHLYQFIHFSFVIHSAIFKSADRSNKRKHVRGRGFKEEKDERQHQQSRQSARQKKTENRLRNQTDEEEEEEDDNLKKEKKKAQK